MEQKRFYRGAIIFGLVVGLTSSVVLFVCVGRAYVTAIASLHPIMLALVIVLACLDIPGIVTALQPDPSFAKAYVAGLIATATLLPGAAILFTVAIYLTETSHKFAPVWGLVIAVEVWLGMAYICRGFAKAEYAVPSSYGELCLRLDQLKADLAGLKPVCSQTFENDLCQVIALKEIETHINKIEHNLQIPEPSWVQGTGYATVWERLYRAEEALIEVAPRDTVLARAMYDESRLQGSKIETRDELQGKLRHAVTVIAPSAVSYLIESTKLMAPLAIGNPTELPEKTVATFHTQTLVRTEGTIPPGRSFDLTIKDTIAASTSFASMTHQEKMARAILRTVRQSINEFRNQSWNGLILARNHLLETMIYTGLITFILLSIAIIWGAERTIVFAASVFYLVGATAGLIDRLRRESQAEAAIRGSDYGLWAARLVTIPLFSGLGAVGGVLLMAMLPYASTVFEPSKATEQSQKISDGVKTPSGEIPLLSTIFDLNKNRMGLFVSAVFGLTPGLLLQKLQQQADKYKADLKSSQATDRTPKMDRVAGCSQTDSG